MTDLAQARLETTSLGVQSKNEAFTDLAMKLLTKEK